MSKKDLKERKIVMISDEKKEKMLQAIGDVIIPELNQHIDEDYDEDDENTYDTIDFDELTNITVDIPNDKLPFLPVTNKELSEYEDLLEDYLNNHYPPGKYSIYLVRNDNGLTADIDIDFAEANKQNSDRSWYDDDDDEDEYDHGYDYYDYNDEYDY
jgi:hypothetical protein